MKSLNEYIIEGGFFKNMNAEIVTPESKNELIKIIDDTIYEHGPNCDLNFIDTSKIDDMSELFYSSGFNGDISKWDVSKVKDTNNMFTNSIFNGDISDWNMNINNMVDSRYMFMNSKLEKLNKVPSWYKNA